MDGGASPLAYRRVKIGSYYSGLAGNSSVMGVTFGESAQFLLRNAKLRYTACQANHKLRKDENGRNIDVFCSGTVDRNFRVEPS